MPLTWIEISKKNLLHNLAQFKNIAPQSEIWPVVKSNAYGHGVREVVKILNEAPEASGLALANLDEALSLLDITSKPLMVLSYFDRDEAKLEIVAKRFISLPVYDLKTIDYLDDLGKKINQSFLLNLKIDTGTSRLGFRVEEATSAIGYVLSKSNVKLNSIFTHYAESESEDLDFSQKQLATFLDITKNFPDIKIHSACSAASVSLPQSQASLIRLGLSLYGLWPSEPTRLRAEAISLDLKPILAFKTTIIQLKPLKKGESVGYNRTYKANHDCQLAVLPVGYWEGLNRLLSNKAGVIIRGVLCPIRGNVCMNLTMVELPLDLDVKVGDTVTLLGTDGADKVTVEDWAKISLTINYEVVTKLNPQIPRVII